MKSFVCLCAALVLTVVSLALWAAEHSPRSVRAEHGTELAARFGSELEQSRQSALLAQQNPSPPDQPQGGAVCGNSVLDAGEQCDDGNATGGDGCSSSCQVESGYGCSAPVPSDLTNLVLDPGFEAGLMGGIWEEFSTQVETPICDEPTCGLPGQRSGDFWVWFGGVDADFEEGRVSQDISIPASASELRFWLAVPNCGSDDDIVELLIDDVQFWLLVSDSPECGSASYVEQVVDISSVADGAVHNLEFHSIVQTPQTFFTDFFIDDVYLAQGPLQNIPSVCQLLQELIFLDGFETLP
jgi:cysteine-rich repeat protein